MTRNSPPPHTCEPQAFTVGDTPAVGLLCLPEGAGWYPAVVVAGEPPEGGAEALTQHLLGLGFAVLTFDAPTGHLAAALLAAADSLLMRPDVRPEMIGLLGFGQGAWAAAYTAARAPETAFAVLVPGATAPTAASLARLADVVCPALVLTSDAATATILEEALLNNPDTDLRPAPTDTTKLLTAIGAWLKEQAV